jgi:hypothetical protein
LIKSVWKWKENLRRNSKIGVRIRMRGRFFEFRVLIFIDKLRLHLESTHQVLIYWKVMKQR